MRGGMGYQITKIFNESGIFKPGTSKHIDKAAARASGAVTWADLGRNLAIYSYNTAETYKDTWHLFGDFAKLEMGLKDIEKTDAGHIKNFLESRVDLGIAYSTYQKEAAALGKLESTLNMYSQKYDRGNIYEFRTVIRESGVEARNELISNQPRRAYQAPQKLLSAISRENHHIAASVQYEGGARIHETSLIKVDQLAGYDQDSITGERVGRIDIVGKGGKERTISVSSITYKKLLNAIERAGEFKLSKGYYRSLRNAAEHTGQGYNGSHGLRWNYARERMDDCQQNGKSYEQALIRVSREMGHQRADITEHYLR
ncbi:MAG: hypothetical protein WC405_04675 [Syntrophales bacterium]